MQQSVSARDFSTRAPEVDADEIDLLAMLRTLWRGKLWVLLCAVLAVGAGAYYAWGVAVPTYRATAQLALQVRTEQVVDLDQMMSGITGDEASMNTEMATIRSRELIGRLVEELRLDQDPEFIPQALAVGEAPATGPVPWLRSWLNLPRDVAPPSREAVVQGVVSEVQERIETASSRGSYVFSISATTRDSEKSALLVNSLARIYREDQVRVKVEATDAAATWLSGRVSELGRELEEQQGAMAELRSRSALVSEESVAALNEQAIALRSELESARGLLARAEERVAALEAAEGEAPAIRATAARDGQLEAIAASVAAGEPGAEVRFERRFDQLVLQADSERTRARESASDIERSVAELGSQYERQAADLLSLQQLGRETEATRVLYETFLTRLRETTVQEGVHQADSRVLSEATPGTLVAPRKPRILALSLVFGLLAGAALVLVREMMQTTFRTPEDLEARTGRPVLGQIPRIPARSRPDSIRYLREKPTSAAAEAIRNLRTSVLLSNVDRPPTVIMSASSIPAEGKTTISIALAQNLAGLERRVLLIEGDIRRRTFGAYFPQARDKAGLVSLIAGKITLEEAVHRPEGSGFDVIMGERSSINAADLFSSESFRRLMDDLRGRYDHIILDTPPVLVVPDARVLAQHVDAVLYVVNWDRTSHAQVEEGLKQFRSVGANVTGVVLSQIDPRGMRRYGYGGKYGAYSRYARGYYEA